MQFWLITNAPDVAAHVLEAGVNRIFLDLESHGKGERQAGRDAWFSSHSLSDIAPVRAVVGEGQLMLRTDPLQHETQETVRTQIEVAIAAGVDRLMTPMVRSAKDVRAVAEIIGRRAPLTPLIETLEGLAAVEEIASVDGVDEIFFGLNDLHIALGAHNMFEPLASGILDEPARRLNALGMPFGFGGVTRIGGGEISADRILGEHVRLGSTSAILSRSMRNGAEDLVSISAAIDFETEIRKLRSAYRRHMKSGPDELEANRRALQAEVRALLDARPRRTSDRSANAEQS